MAAALALLVTGFGPTVAQEAAETAADAAEQQRQREREQRIADFLKKKEARIAEREKQRALTEAAEGVDDPMASRADRARAEAESAAAMQIATTPAPGARPLPKDLAEAQAALRRTALAQDPTVQAYMSKIDRAEASPQQLAAFGNFLSQNGMTRLALVYYDVALRLERRDAVLWVNIGTLQRQLGEFDRARTSFARALDLNPANAYAHYNLGALYDDQGKYKRAIEEYKIALTIDPTLGDPAYNPAAANNNRLLAVKLMIYQEQAGNVGLPLIDVAGGQLPNLTPLRRTSSTE